MENVKKRVVVITGASSGIGRSLAEVFAKNGYKLGLMARRANLLEDIKKEIIGRFPSCEVLTAVCDVNNHAECGEKIRFLSGRLGSLDIFIANAGIGYSTPAWKHCSSGVMDIFQTNVMGAVGSLESAKEIMLAQKSGCLVGISSIAAYRGLPVSSAYCAGKAALSTYLESVRLDLKHSNIRVTSIHPGFILTPMTEKNAFMPFLLTAEKAAEKIFRAICKGKRRYVFPWPMKLMVWIMRYMPDWLYDRLISIKSPKGVFGGR